MLDWMNANIYASALPFENDTVISMFEYETRNQEFLDYLSAIETQIHAARKPVRNGCEEALIFSPFNTMSPQ